MIIGFTQRSRTVPESSGAATDLYPIDIQVASVRVSERLHGITIRHNEQLSTAVVGPLIGENIISDALFGLRNLHRDPLQLLFDLNPGQTTLQRVSAFIVQDFRIEPEECFTLQLYFYATPGAREPLVTCNAGDSSTNFFCEHTVCIEDDDELFMVGFVQTTYTVLENAGSVEVCVQLTRPVTDILEETVRVSVVDYSSSVYIPAGAALATPDSPNFLGLYSMAQGTDYAQQTRVYNSIDDHLIS
ncbi:hypothetical protein GBAR_LOCUS29128, partial [Geodia barretti]